MPRDLPSEIRALIDQHPILIFMKGNRDNPMCGFSATAVRIFDVLGAPYETVDILGDSALREAIKTFSSWPTIPQVYVKGQFLGGSDIVREMYERGELEMLVQGAIAH